MFDTLDVVEASDYLKCSERTIKNLIANGVIPAAKFGQGYVMLKEDLANCIRLNYANGEKLCQYIKEQTPRTTTFSSRSTDNAYEKALKPRTSKKRNN